MEKTETDRRDPCCPQCGTDAPNTICGWEIRGVYDGILFWVCLKCRHAFPREFNGRRDDKSRHYAAVFNDEVAAQAETP